METDIIIRDNGIMKFVILSNDNKRMLIGDPDASFHQNIVNPIRRKNPNLFCDGGGRLSLIENKLKIWGYSVDFGEPDKSLINDILEPYCKEKNLEFENNIGIGY